MELQLFFQVIQRNSNENIVEHIKLNILFLKVKYRRHILIQTLSILFLCGFFMSFFWLVFANLAVFAFSMLEMTSNGYNFGVLIIRGVMILVSVIVSILDIIYFIIIQFYFLANIEKIN
jgi:hypothetical protein